MRFDPIRIEVLRGDSVESRHLVDAVVTDSAGVVIETHGSVEAPVFCRSMIKPIQAIPFLLSGAPAQSPDAIKAIAISCSSHASEHLHIDFLRDWHQRLGLESEACLTCGPQTPDDQVVADEIVRAFAKPKRINNNCSGKHTGMIATAIALNLSHEGYAAYDHPIQVEVRKHMSRWAGVDVDKAKWAIDGCGLPTYALSQITIARMMSAMHEGELREIREACAREPYMVGGHGWVCSEINAGMSGRIFAKVGAEGNYAAVIYGDSKNEAKTIIAKSRDGAFRATEAALADLLDRHARLSDTERSSIRSFATPPLKNWAGTIVGSLRTSLSKTS